MTACRFRFLTLFPLGIMVLGPPSEWTYLRTAKWWDDGEEKYTASSSGDGIRFVRGGT